MEQARPADDRAPVRSERFELVDGRGRVRAVLGDVGAADAYVPGLALLDGLGRRRSWYALFVAGPSLSFDADGNEVLNLGVSDDRDSSDDARDYDPAGYLVLSDGDGRPRLRLRVRRDGTSEDSRADGPGAWEG